MGGAGEAGGDVWGRCGVPFLSAVGKVLGEKGLRMISAPGIK